MHSSQAITSHQVLHISSSSSSSSLLLSQIFQIVERNKMVKFSKQYEGQLVPEWKAAFVDYWQLKKDLKRIHLLINIQPTSLPNREHEHHPSTPVTEADTFLSSLKKFSPFGHHQPRTDGAIQVHKKLASSDRQGDLYETELVEQFSDLEAAKEFFACLDHQLNKVNKFFRTKEREFLERGESLKRQIEILAELKAFVSEQSGKDPSLAHDVGEEDASISCAISCEEESIVKGQDQEQMQEKKVLELDELGTSDELPLTESAKWDEAGKSGTIKREYSNKLRSLSSRSFSCQGKNLKVNIPLTTPSRAFLAISDLVREDLISPASKKCNSEGNNKMQINRTKLQHAEKMIKKALIELYKGLGYLNTYRNLNMLAFVKILKKFDKVTGKQVLPIYLRVVESSYFNSSDKVMHLGDEVEELFVKQFAAADQRKALKYLKPLQRTESHGTTFLVGLFTGCLIALFTGYVIMAHVTGIYRRKGDRVYMETVYPILRQVPLSFSVLLHNNGQKAAKRSDPYMCSMFSLFFLHFFLYGCNIFAWRKARINYSFIFELTTPKELKYRDVFLICAASMAVVVGVMFVHLSVLTKGSSDKQVQSIPGLLLLSFVLLLVCPCNIFYQSSRYRLLRVIRNIIFSPLYKVVMLDFFMADQLCSQIPMLRNLEYLTCYYITGSYKTQDYKYCMQTKHYRDLAYAVSFLPYYWRAMQCARRWFDEGHTSHLVNLGKYVSAMLAAGAKVAYEKEQSFGWLFLVVVISSGATIYQLYWDFVKDWGLLQMNSKNQWLRNELMLRRKFVYYLSMGLNLVLRLAWLQTVLHYSFENVDYRVTGLFLAALEVLRRGLWNFFRLENEHLNNAGKFRAVKTVPLPFHEVDEEG
ncbi:phosphate transporter PHO1 homolog 1-like [Syzygium oleosum]|uniref:phosphate transporter PHO1 homolog 1-like n=1 Tax=Syzygium oleosum TaxID=219896 RepID=UPI0024BB7FF4|nr:phosphate transporter PHO1 homolog 1-like [Syzygium oleosum]